jgi:hypothetical protein
MFIMEGNKWNIKKLNFNKKIISDSQLNISKKIYDFQIEMIYWDKYIGGLKDFLLYQNVTKSNKYKIQNEITRIESYKYTREIKFEDFLSFPKLSTEFKNKLKTFKNDTKIKAINSKSSSNK